MKKIFMTLLMLLFATSITAVDQLQHVEQPAKKQLRVVKMSLEQWKTAKNKVDKTGICRFDEQNVVLIITNGLHSADYAIPQLPTGGRPKMLRRRFAREPRPYQGQTTH